MNTIIIYETKHGAARRCAQLLSGKLTGKVDIVDVKEGKLPDLAKYDKVIIGGAIYVGNVMKELKDFCEKNKDELKNKKLGFYICCMNAKEAEKQLKTAYPQELLDKAIAAKNFGGEFKFKEMNFFERQITKMVSKVLAKEDPSLVIDTKSDISMLSENNINELAQLMNNAS